MRFVIIVLAALALGSCGRFDFGTGFGTTPLATVPSEPRERSISADEALRLINDHRVAKGRPPLATDPRLNRIAAETAREIARRNTTRTEMHTPAGLRSRLEAAGYPEVRAAENLGAGYPTLVRAVEGWKGSSDHNRNLLNRDFAFMGIGLALTDEGPFHSYWVLVLARPDERI